MSLTSLITPLPFFNLNFLRQLEEPFSHPFTHITCCSSSKILLVRSNHWIWLCPWTAWMSCSAPVIPPALLPYTSQNPNHNMLSILLMSIFSFNISHHADLKNSYFIQPMWSCIFLKLFQYSSMILWGKSGFGVPEALEANCFLHIHFFPGLFNHVD